MFEYNFDLKTELKIYKKVGNKNGFVITVSGKTMC